MKREEKLLIKQLERNKRETEKEKKRTEREAQKEKLKSVSHFLQPVDYTHCCRHIFNSVLLLV